MRLKRPDDGIEVTVDGVGDIPLPITLATARKLKSVARPAMFGHREQTLTDLSVRDTWEIPASAVTVGGPTWEALLGGVLDEVKDKLAMPSGARLRVEPHAMLVYGKGQFFAPHQDSEKDDAMVATLVLSLPSAHTGGELIVEHAGQQQIHAASRTELAFVAFYADARHEVRKVGSGHRVTLTFNLMLETEPAAIDADEALAALLHEHFTTPGVRRWSWRDTEPVPNRLVFLLDHEYSQRGLEADLLKGADADRVAALRAVAARAGYHTALAAAEIHESWNTDGDDWDDYHEFDDEEGEYVDDRPYGRRRSSPRDPADRPLTELLTDEITLGWWVREGAEHGETISLTPDEAQVCAATPTVRLRPYESEYEGYMGNYGNTVERWYRRAALVVWPHEHDFSARAEADPAGAVFDLTTRLNEPGADRTALRADAATLVGLLPGSGPASLLPAAIPLAIAVDDADLASSLLGRFSGEGLTTETSADLVAATARYGLAWAEQVLGTWFTSGGYVVGRPEFITRTLPGLCASLRNAGADHLAGLLARRLWQVQAHLFTSALSASPDDRAGFAARHTAELAAIVEASDADGVTRIAAELATGPVGVLDLLRPLLRTVSGPKVAPLATEAVRHLETVAGRRPRTASDWSITWTGCGCHLCDHLARFLADEVETTELWPLKTDDRRHVHAMIDQAGLPVLHPTLRTGRPYKLSLLKAPDLHAQEEKVRAQAAADLTWLRTAYDMG